MQIKHKVLVKFLGKKKLENKTINLLPKQIVSFEKKYCHYISESYLEVTDVSRRKYRVFDRDSQKTIRKALCPKTRKNVKAEKLYELLSFCFLLISFAAIGGAITANSPTISNFFEDKPTIAEIK